MRARLSAASLAALALLAGAARPARGEPPSAEQVESQVKASEEALARLRDKATSVLDELEAAESSLRDLQAAAAQADAEVHAAEARVAAAKADEAAAREALIAQLDLLAPRLEARYRLSRAHRAGILLSARSVGELLRRQRALEAVLAGDLELLKLARSAFERLEARRLAHEQARMELEKRARAADERRAKARQRKEELAALHDALLEEQGLREKMLEELYKTQTRLAHYVKELKPGEQPADGFAARKGTLPFPTAGHIEVGFGKVLNPKFNTVTSQNGLDLRAPEGSEVRAVAPGVIVHASPFRGYGNLVIVDHGEGYHTLYAHLSVISRTVGESVQEGQALGQVGDTGSLKGAYLYFELRRKGKPIDPKDWLGAPR